MNITEETRKWPTEAQKRQNKFYAKNKGNSFMLENNEWTLEGNFQSGLHFKLVDKHYYRVFTLEQVLDEGYKE